jgi:hypothetical protein
MKPTSRFGNFSQCNVNAMQMIYRSSHQFTIEQPFESAIFPPGDLLFQHLKEIGFVDIVLASVDVIEWDHIVSCFHIDGEAFVLIGTRTKRRWRSSICTTIRAYPLPNT